MMLKCIVWDLDETIWSGALRNEQNIELNKKAVEIIKLADASGIIQSIASRNDYDAATRLMTELKIAHYFIYPQIDVNISKVSSIRRITEHFNINTDAVAFVDDNPYELYEVSRYLPEVYTYNANDLSLLREYIAGLKGGLENRRELMLMREQRLNAELKFKGSREDFLKECKMVLTVRDACTNDLLRAKELASRANRLNNTRQRLNTDEIGMYISDSNKLMYVCELEDIFGSHGIIGICLLSICELLFIDLFCISCRVEGRGIGAAFLNETLHCAHRLNSGIKQAVCGYKPYEKDKSAYLLLKLLGFSVVNKGTDRVLMSSPLPVNCITPEWITVKMY